jgi:imidazole glycerol-phosphate synthase subunit HisH
VSGAFLTKIKNQDPLIAGIEPGSFVYFVHSYYVDPASVDVTVAATDHGIDFAAIVHKDNLWATQFHPEKSQKVGERLLDNFGRL